MGTCSQDVSVGLPGWYVCHLLSLPVPAPAPGALPAACLLAPGSLVPQGPLDLPAHQDCVHQDCVHVHFPPQKFWFSSLIVLQHLA